VFMRYILLSIVVLVSGVYGCTGRKKSPVAESKPNVIIVLTDDQGYGDLGCHGNPVLKTPNLEAFHDEAVRFTNFHVSPFCTPTRAAIMTGNNPAYTGAYRTSSGRTMLHREEKTVAKIEIAGQSMEQTVQDGSKGVVFEIDLPAGPTELLTFLYDKKGEAGGAYFTEVELLFALSSALKKTK